MDVYVKCYFTVLSFKLHFQPVLISAETGEAVDDVAVESSYSLENSSLDRTCTLHTVDSAIKGTTVGTMAADPSNFAVDLHRLQTVMDGCDMCGTQNVINNSQQHYDSTALYADRKAPVDASETSSISSGTEGLVIDTRSNSPTGPDVNQDTSNLLAVSDGKKSPQRSSNCCPPLGIYRENLNELVAVIPITASNDRTLERKNKHHHHHRHQATSSDSAKSTKLTEHLHNPENGSSLSDINALLASGNAALLSAAVNSFLLASAGNSML
ncbi:unnamed protein product [Gongylonema pulchrum]|uniref:Pecanex-like protein n=1 Tax=Gongylonema pulchrum TaxID=637853 RepID=A0A183ERR8_9BILA|nr:unnamed protein product [Gongylonema pulchrum]